MSTVGTFLGGVPTITPGQGTSNYSGYNSAIGQGIGSVGQAQGNQSALIQALQNQANGIGPSVAQQQFQQNNQRIAAQAAGAIAGQKGINPGLGGQLIARNQAAVQGQAAGQGALARTQEQLGAQSQLGTAIGQQGQMGLGLAGLGTQGQLGQNNEYINQQQIAAGQNATNAGLGNQLLGSIAKGASSAFGIPAVTGVAGMWTGGPIDYRDGGSIPGHAVVAGDSRRNDTVPIMASPDEIMIPRSITTHPDAPELAKQFVEGILAKKGKGKAKSHFDDGGTVKALPYTDPDEDKKLPAPPLVRAPVPLPFHGGTLDRYSPVPDQMKQMPKLTNPADAGAPRNKEEEDTGPKKTYFSDGGIIDPEVLHNIIHKAISSAMSGKKTKGK